MQVCKPGSVSPFIAKQYIYHLSSRPTLLRLPPFGGIRRAALNRNLFGLSTSEVFPTRLLPPAPVSSYLTFSLSPRVLPRGYLAFCGTFCYQNISVSAPTLSGGGLPCVARTFLSNFHWSDRKTCAIKVMKKTTYEIFVD